MPDQPLPEDIETRVRLLKEDWIAEIDRGLRHIRPFIQEQFHVNGIIGLISDPFIDMGATAYLKTMRKTALRQMDVALACALEAIKIGDTRAAVDKHFPRFLDLDEIFKNARKGHRKIADIKLSLHDEFVLRVEDTVNLLTAPPADRLAQVAAVGDVYKLAYNGISDAKTIQERELAHVKERIDMVREDETLLSIPFGLRSKVFKVVEYGYNYTRETFEQNLQRYFS